MEKLQARKKVYLWLLILLSLCALIPLAVLSKYNHQSGDDYGYAYRTFQIWRESHSFWNVIKEAFATSAEIYQKWQGLYASAVLRDAENELFVLDQIYLRTGFKVKVVSNSEHRFISYKSDAGAGNWRDLLSAASCRFL